MEKGIKQESAELISKETTLGDIVKKFPAAMGILMNHGLPVGGCSSPYWASIEEVSKDLEMDLSMMNQIITESNNAVSKAREDLKDGQIVHFSSVAVKKVRQFMDAEKKTDSVLRISVVEGGCSGMSYHFAIQKAAEEGDAIIEKDKIKIALEKESVPYLQGSRIDYVESLHGSGFKVDNPNAKHTCACGESFH